MSRQKIGLSYKFQKREKKNGCRYYYSMYGTRLLCSTNCTNDDLEITEYGNYIDIKDCIYNIRTCRMHNVLCINPDVDTWWDLVHHFLWHDYFDTLYVNASGDVIVYYNFDYYGFRGYFEIKGMSMNVVTYHKVKPNKVYKTINKLPERGFCILDDNCDPSKAVNKDPKIYTAELLAGFHPIITHKDTYKSVKMVRERIQNENMCVVRAMYDAVIVCAN